MHIESLHIIIIIKNRQQGNNHRWKVEGDQGLGPNPEALATHARP